MSSAGGSIPDVAPVVSEGPAPGQSPLLAGYRRAAGIFDEVLDGAGCVRPHYTSLFAELDELGQAELARRSEAGRRISHEQGVAYNVYGDPRGMERAWELDPVPLLISPAEWSGLEKALVQRATLLNRILADCYGPQELLRSQWLPPSLVFAQPDFPRPVHGVRVPNGVFLNFYAADLARSPDGQWWVTCDRTQIPTGAGYALANRNRSSNDLWRTLRKLDDVLSPTDSGNERRFAGDAVRVLSQVILSIASFHGLARENMTRAQGWRFLDMGVRIERALYLCSFLESALNSAESDNPSVLETVLEVADNTITYRSRYNLLPNIAAVYDLVLLDDSNPRSLFFQLSSIVRHLEQLPRARETALPSPADRILISCMSRLRLLDPRPLSPMAGGWHESEVAQVLREITAELPRLSDAIAVSYFAHSEITHSGWVSRRSGEAEVQACPSISVARNEGRSPGIVL